jgi:hypothetical protein
MSYFKVKIVILLVGIFFLSGCFLSADSPIENVPVKVKVAENKQTIVPEILSYLWEI